MYNLLLILLLLPVQVIFSKYTDLLPKEVLNDDAPELQRPDEEAVKEVSSGAVCRYRASGVWDGPGLIKIPANWIFCV